MEKQPESKVGDGQSLLIRLQHFLLGEKESLRLNAEYFDAVKLEKILHFLESKLAYRMWAAQRRGGLYREQPFVLGIDARRLGRDFPEDEKVLIQGIIGIANSGEVQWSGTEGVTLSADRDTGVVTVGLPHQAWDAFVLISSDPIQGV